MENLKHPHIAQHIVCPELENQIKAAFERNLKEGSDYTATRFRQALDSYVSSLISTPKGMSALNENLNDIKSHFCRGRKWVVIPKDNDLYQTVIEKAQENEFNDLVNLFEKNQKAHVRFHSASTNGISFSIHPNSSESSKVKVLINTEIGLTLEVLDGTPKSNGLEGESKKKKKKAKVKTEEITPVDLGAQCEEIIADMMKAVPEDALMEDDDRSEYLESEGPNEEELINTATSMEEWEQLLANEGIDIDFSDESFESFDEENMEMNAGI